MGVGKLYRPIHFWKLWTFGWSEFMSKQVSSRVVGNADVRCGRRCKHVVDVILWLIFCAGVFMSSMTPSIYVVNTAGVREKDRERVVGGRQKGQVSGGRFSEQARCYLRARDRKNKMKNKKIKNKNTEYLLTSQGHILPFQKFFSWSDHIFEIYNSFAIDWWQFQLILSVIWRVMAI